MCLAWFSAARRAKKEVFSPLQQVVTEEGKDQGLHRWSSNTPDPSDAVAPSGRAAASPSGFRLLRHRADLRAPKVRGAERRAGKNCQNDLEASRADHNETRVRLKKR